MVPSLTTADTDSFFLREPVGCEPSTTGPGPWGGGGAQGSFMPTFFFFFSRLFKHTIMKFNYKIQTMKPDLPERPLRHCLRLGGHVQLSAAEETVGRGI